MSWAGKEEGRLVCRDLSGERRRGAIGEPGRAISLFFSNSPVRHRLSPVSEIIPLIDLNRFERAVAMKEFVCFSMGLILGAVLMKRSRMIDELQRELDRERQRSDH